MAYSSLVEKAMRFAASAHHSQRRKGTDIPYLTHLAGVTLILARAGFDDDEILAAALLHDAVEDAGVTLETIAARFSPRVAALVEAVSEVKHDAEGVKSPWRTRKEEHLARLRLERLEARAIALADKLHNLGTLIDDLAAEPAAWSRFNASPADQLWYHAAIIDAAGDDPRLAPLANDCRVMLERLRSLAPAGELE